jgi:hypothetical protein
MIEREATIEFDGYAGRYSIRCVIERESEKRYFVRLLEAGKLAGRSKYGQPGDRLRVPKSAVRILSTPAPSAEVSST